MQVMSGGMITRKCVTISLGSELHAVAERLLASGRYGNLSEVVRAAMRLLDERELRFTEHRNQVRLGESA